MKHPAAMRNYARLINHVVQRTRLCPPVYETEASLIRNRRARHKPRRAKPSPQSLVPGGLRLRRNRNPILLASSFPSCISKCLIHFSENACFCMEIHTNPRKFMFYGSKTAGSHLLASRPPAGGPAESFRPGRQTPRTHGKPRSAEQTATKGASGQHRLCIIKLIC